MAKDTFHNLKADKKVKVKEVLKKAFSRKPFHEVTVKEIVEETGMARGSFYQYFDSLEDAYFTVLDAEITDVHALFMRMLEHQTADVEKALRDYGERLSEILFKEENYPIYKNRYLYWNESLDRHWREKYQGGVQMLSEGGDSLDAEKIHYLKGVLHMLIRRNFQEGWTREMFLQKFKRHLDWMMKGVKGDGGI